MSGAVKLFRDSNYLIISNLFVNRGIETPINTPVYIQFNDKIMFTIGSDNFQVTYNIGETIIRSTEFHEFKEFHSYLLMSLMLENKDDITKNEHKIYDDELYKYLEPNQIWTPFQPINKDSLLKTKDFKSLGVAKPKIIETLSNV